MKSFGDMVKQAQKVQQRMAELQEKFAEERFTASAGGGLVQVVVDGKQRLKEIKLGPDALKEDSTLLEDLILTAVAEAQKTSEDAMQEAIAKVTGGFKLPF